MELNKSLILGVLSTLSFAACAPKNSETSQLQTSNSHSAIIAGIAVNPNDALAKSIVGIISMHQGQKGAAICTGSLLPGNMILTAAHCVDDYMAVTFGVSMGPDSGAQSRQVDLVTISPYWKLRQNADKDHSDIALLHFKGDVPAGFVPAEFLTDMTALQNGASVLLAGYGVNQVMQKPIDVKTYPDLINAIQTGKVVCDDDKNLTNCAEVAMLGAGTLRQTTVKIADSKFAVTEILLNQTLGTGACHGDSGGPAYVIQNGKLYLWGITSRGEQDPRNDCSKYSVYTNAADIYKNWITRVGELWAKNEAAAAQQPAPVTPAPKNIAIPATVSNSTTATATSNTVATAGK